MEVVRLAGSLKGEEPKDFAYCNHYQLCEELEQGLSGINGNSYRERLTRLALRVKERPPVYDEKIKILTVLLKIANCLGMGAIVQPNSAWLESICWIATSFSLDENWKEAFTAVAKSAVKFPYEAEQSPQVHILSYLSAGNNAKLHEIEAKSRERLFELAPSFTTIEISWEAIQLQLQSLDPENEQAVQAFLTMLNHSAVATQQLLEIAQSVLNKYGCTAFYKSLLGNLVKKMSAEKTVGHTWLRGLLLCCSGLKQPTLLFETYKQEWQSILNKYSLLGPASKSRFKNLIVNEWEAILSVANAYNKFCGKRRMKIFGFVLNEYHYTLSNNAEQLDALLKDFASPCISQVSKLLLLHIFWNIIKKRQQAFNWESEYPSVVAWSIEEEKQKGFIENELLNLSLKGINKELIVKVLNFCKGKETRSLFQITKLARFLFANWPSSFRDDVNYLLANLAPFITGCVPSTAVAYPLKEMEASTYRSWLTGLFFGEILNIIKESVYRTHDTGPRAIAYELPYKIFSQPRIVVGIASVQGRPVQLLQLEVLQLLQEIAKKTSEEMQKNPIDEFKKNLLNRAKLGLGEFLEEEKKFITALFTGHQMSLLEAIGLITCVPMKEWNAKNLEFLAGLAIDKIIRESGGRGVSPRARRGHSFCIINLSVLKHFYEMLLNYVPREVINRHSLNIYKISAASLINGEIEPFKFLGYFKDANELHYKYPEIAYQMLGENILPLYAEFEAKFPTSFSNPLERLARYERLAKTMKRKLADAVATYEREYIACFGKVKNFKYEVFKALQPKLLKTIETWEKQMQENLAEAAPLPSKVIS